MKIDEYEEVRKITFESDKEVEEFRKKVFERAEKYVKDYNEGIMYVDPEILNRNSSARIMKFDLEKYMNEYKFRDDKHTELYKVVTEIDDRCYNMLKLGLLKYGGSKDEKINSLEKQVADFKVQLKEEREKADYFKERYETLRDSQSNKKFTGKLDKP